MLSAHMHQTFTTIENNRKSLLHLDSTEKEFVFCFSLTFNQTKIFKLHSLPSCNTLELSCAFQVQHHKPVA